jgi:Tfp pilus assembly protein PilV
MNSRCKQRIRKSSGIRRLILGVHLVEVLVASAIMSVSLAAIVSMFVFGYRITQHSDDTSIAYNVCRQELERVRLEGFKNTVLVRDVNGVVISRGLDGTETFYYSLNGTKLENSTGAAYSVIITIISDKFDTITGGVLRPADDSLRTVTVVVTRLSDNTVVHREGTYLSRSGV